MVWLRRACIEWTKSGRKDHSSKETNATVVESIIDLHIIMHYSYLPSLQCFKSIHTMQNSSLPAPTCHMNVSDVCVIS